MQQIFVPLAKRQGIFFNFSRGRGASRPNLPLPLWNPLWNAVRFAAQFVRHTVDPSSGPKPKGEQARKKLDKFCTKYFWEQARRITRLVDPRLTFSDAQNTKCIAERHSCRRCDIGFGTRRIH